MKNIIVSHHLGMGDVVAISPAIRFFSKKCDNLYIFSKEEYFANTEKLYKDIKNLKIIKVYSEINDVKNFISNFTEEYEYFSSGIFKTNHHPFVSLPDNFYEDLNLPFEIYDDYFHIPDSSINNTVFNEIKKLNYIFVCGTTSIADYTQNIISNIYENCLILSPSYNHYPEGHEYHLTAKSVMNLPLFDYVNILKNAKEIHTVGHVFGILAKFVCKNKKEKNLHNCSKLNLSVNFFKDWNIIDY